MKMKSKRYWLPTEFMKNAAETIEACIMYNEKNPRVIYCHYKNGYFSLIEGVKNLADFLNGDTSKRFSCCNSYKEVFEELDRIDTDTNRLV